MRFIASILLINNHMYSCTTVQQTMVQQTMVQQTTVQQMTVRRSVTVAIDLYMVHWKWQSLTPLPKASEWTDWFFVRIDYVSNLNIYPPPLIPSLYHV